MNSQSQISNPKSQITIVGAGPAGASLAIRLARKNFRVTLIERERFPRQKLCGEFVSPECLRHLRELEVFDSMIAANGERISETVFYAANGKSVSVPSRWFNENETGALSLSRAEMDFRLLEKAKSCGVEVLEESSVTGVLSENEKVCGVKIKDKNGAAREVFSDLTIDATGRAKVLEKLAAREFSDKNSARQSLKNKSQNAKLVGFKTHLKNVNLAKDLCEIYFFRGGYGGLSFVENDRANHCFLMKAEVVKEFGGDADEIVEQVIFRNKRARETMRNAEKTFDWLAVSVDEFGRKNLNPAKNLFAVGDAAAFIDPFTGSGMLMAFESAEILAEAITENFSAGTIAARYETEHARKFRRRLFVCSLVRRAAFAPKLAERLISVLSFNELPKKFLAKATRPRHAER